MAIQRILIPVVLESRMAWFYPYLLDLWFSRTKSNITAGEPHYGRNGQKCMIAVLTPVSQKNHIPDVKALK